DQSNIEGCDVDLILLLPKNPDGSARSLKLGLERRFRVSLAVVIADSFGRPFRNGTTGIAIGASGLSSFVDKRGAPDLFGRPLEVSTIAHGDEIASAASLIMGQADEGAPVVLIRGLDPTADVPASALIRPIDEDLFR
ncbi:MAG: coenzyme F420-0:L-glutamate ligase, partial [Pseudomonadota bacterium]